jgi:hypothetical protein
MSEPQVDKNLDKAWHRYQEKVQEELRQLAGDSREKGSLRLVSNKALHLRALVDDLERGPEFKSLVTEVRSTFLPQGYHGGDVSFWEWALENFMRRSGFYSALSEGKSVTQAEMLTRLSDAFHKRTTQVTFLAPMEFIELGCESMAFKRFIIRRFTRPQLGDLLQNSVNEMFYPWAYVDAHELGWYSFIVVTDTKPTEALGHFGTILGDIGKVNIQYTKYPVIEEALQELALVDWEPQWRKEEEHESSQWRQWERFHVPFVMEVEDDLLRAPRHAPDLSKLATEPWTDGATGEDLGWRPSVSISLDSKETEMFQSFLNRVDERFQKVKANASAWPFFERGLGFLVKAFFTYDLEQLLWHIAAMEALLGENKEGITDRLKRRVGAILGANEAEGQALRKQFKELYDFRSDLVHGDEFEKQIREGHLRTGRDLARRVVLWFLHFLAGILDHAPDGGYPDGPPRREELLLLIDQEPSARARLAKVMLTLPPDFPHIEAWGK